MPLLVELGKRDLTLEQSSVAVVYGRVMWQANSNAAPPPQPEAGAASALSISVRAA